MSGTEMSQHKSYYQRLDLQKNLVHITKHKNGCRKSSCSVLPNGQTLRRPCHRRETGMRTRQEVEGTTTTKQAFFFQNSIFCRLENRGKQENVISDVPLSQGKAHTSDVIVVTAETISLHVYVGHYNFLKK